MESKHEGYAGRVIFSNGSLSSTKQFVMDCKVEAVFTSIWDARLSDNTGINICRHYSAALLYEFMK